MMQIRFMRFYKNLRLRQKITFTHLIIAVIPMVVIGIFCYTNLYDMIVSNTISKEQHASSQAAPLIEDAVRSVLNTQDILSYTDFYKQLTDSSGTGDLDRLASSVQAEQFQKEIRSFVQGDLITDIRLYLDIPVSSDLFSEEFTASAFLPIREAYGTYWYGIFSGSPYTYSLLCPSFYLCTEEIQNYGTLAYITRTSVTYKSEKREAYIAVYFSEEYLTQLLEHNLQSDDTIAYLLNSRNSQIASTNSLLSGAYHFDYDEITDYLISSNSFIAKNIMGTDVYASFTRIRNSDWYLVIALPSMPMITKSISITAGFMLMYIAFIVFSFYIANFLSRTTTNRLSTVIDHMGKCRNGPPLPLPASNNEDEIGDLINTYNYMVRVINGLMKKQQQTAENLRIAEFNSLQAQINPHFLYNTMDMINWLAQQGRTADVSFAIQKLSRFYKLTLSRKQTISTISDELEHVSIYVQLQNMRFHNNIDFLIDIPDTISDCAIPKLTFQPVIENCILHGIMEKEDKHGTIVLTGWLDEDDLVILISDDGVGIPPELLPEILSGNHKSGNGSGSNIAVYNTHRRLQLMYGPSYGLSYSSIPGAGTEVEIRIPLHCGIPPLALQLLSDPELHLMDVALQCGYKDLDVFSDTFEKIYHCSPEEYRQHIL